MDELNITSEGLLDAVGDMLAESGLVSDASAVKMDDTVATMTVVPFNHERDGESAAEPIPYEFSSEEPRGAYLVAGKIAFTGTKTGRFKGEPPLIFGPLPKGALLWVGPTKERGGAIFPVDADYCTPITRSNAIALRHRYRAELEQEECTDGELYSVK